MTQSQMTTYLADKIGISKRQAKSALSAAVGVSRGDARDHREAPHMF